MVSVTAWCARENEREHDWLSVMVVRAILNINLSDSYDGSRGRSLGITVCDLDQSEPSGAGAFRREKLDVTVKTGGSPNRAVYNFHQF